MVRRSDPSDEAADPRSGDALALRANDLVAIRNRTAAQTQELRQIIAALAPMIEQWSDPRSLGYQAQVHATYMLDPADWPQHLGQTVLWHECARQLVLPALAPCVPGGVRGRRPRTSRRSAARTRLGPAVLELPRTTDPAPRRRPCRSPSAMPRCPTGSASPDSPPAPVSLGPIARAEPGRPAASGRSRRRSPTGRTRPRLCVASISPTPRTAISSSFSGGYLEDLTFFHSSSSSARWTCSRTGRGTSRPAVSWRVSSRPDSTRSSGCIMPTSTGLWETYARDHSTATRSPTDARPGEWRRAGLRVVVRARVPLPPGRRVRRRGPLSPRR